MFVMNVYPKEEEGSPPIIFNLQNPNYGIMIPLVYIIF